MVGPLLTEDLSSLPLLVIPNRGSAIPRGCFGKYVEIHGSCHVTRPGGEQEDTRHLSV